MLKNLRHLTPIAAALVALPLVGCGLGMTDGPYKKEADNFFKTANCDKNSSEVQNMDEESAILTCKIGETDYTAIISNTATYLDNQSKEVCKPVPLPDKSGTLTPENLPGKTTCYLRGENYVVYPSTTYDPDAKKISKPNPKDQPTLPGRL